MKQPGGTPSRRRVVGWTKGEEGERVEGGECRSGRREGAFRRVV